MNNYSNPILMILSQSFWPAAYREPGNEARLPNLYLSSMRSGQNQTLSTIPLYLETDA